MAQKRMFSLQVTDTDRFLDVWTNFLLALMDETDSAFAREQKATNPRIQKYTAKYRR